MKKRILFISEDITLAQVVRLKVLAESLKDHPYDIHFASAGNFRDVIGNSLFNNWKIRVISQEKAEKAVYECKRIYDEVLLQEYITDDLALIEKVKPDLIISDFRLSLPISARLSNVPFAILINSYWSPDIKRASFPMPDHPLEKLLGYRVMKFFYKLVRPFVFRNYANPVNKLRNMYRMTSISSLQDLVTYGDYVLFPDTPSLSPAGIVKDSRIFLGPVLWSPDNEISDDLKFWMATPYIYVTLGSSGRTDRINELLKGLERVDCNVILASAGKYQAKVPKNVLVKPYVLGAVVARNAMLVISNGGSTTSYQALNEGTPVIGIATNLDQYLCMENIVKAGAGILLRGGSFTSTDIFEAVTKVLSDPSFRVNAEKIKNDFHSYDSGINFVDFVQRLLDTSGNKIKGSSIEALSYTGG